MNLITTHDLLRKTLPTAQVVNLHDYHEVFVRSSAGKDSQAMLDYVIEVADAQGYPRSRIQVTHSDLGQAEWRGTTALAREQAEHYGLKFVVVKRPQGDILDQARKLRKFPMPTQRYCTSDHKRAQLAKPVTAAHAAWKASGNRGLYRALECLGMRAKESPGRGKMAAFSPSARLSTQGRSVDTWLPIHTWTVEQVWERIKASGVRYHEAYDFGMPRLSCVFCVLSNHAALTLAAKHNPELLDAYVAVEDKIQHTFKKGYSLRVLRDTVRAGGALQGPVTDWTM